MVQSWNPTHVIKTCRIKRFKSKFTKKKRTTEVTLTISREKTDTGTKDRGVFTHVRVNLYVSRSALLLLTRHIQISQSI